MPVELNEENSESAITHPRIKCKLPSCKKVFWSYSASYTHFRNAHSMIPITGRDDHLDFLSSSQRANLRLNLQTCKPRDFDLFKGVLDISISIRREIPLNLFNGFVFDTLVLKFTLNPFDSSLFGSTIEELLFLFFIDSYNIFPFIDVLTNMLKTIYRFIEFLNGIGAENVLSRNYKLLRNNSKYLMSLHLVNEIYLEDMIVEFNNFYLPVYCEESSKLGSILLLFGNWLRKEQRSDMKIRSKRYRK